MQQKLKRVLWVLILLATAVEVIGVCAGGFEIADHASWRQNYGIEELWFLCMLPLVVLSVVFQVRAFPRGKKYGLDRSALEQDLFDVWEHEQPKQPKLISIGHLLNAIGVSCFFIFLFVEVGDEIVRDLGRLDRMERLFPILFLLVAILMHLLLYWQWVDYGRRVNQS